MRASFHGDNRFYQSSRTVNVSTGPQRALYALTVVCSMAFFQNPVTAQEADRIPESLPSASLTAVLETRGNLTLHDATLTEALFALQQQWKIDMVVSDNVDGTVNATFTGASLREILDSLLLSRGYGYRILGNSIVVLPLDQLGALKPLFQSQMIPLQNADPAELLGVVELLLSPQGKALAIQSARSIMVLDYPDRAAMIRQQIESLDQKAAAPSRREPGLHPRTNPVTGPDSLNLLPAPDGAPLPERSDQAEPIVPADPGTIANATTVELDVRVFRPQYVTVETLLPAIESLLSSNGRTAVLEKEDQVVVADEGHQLDVIEEAILALDRPRPQVRIWAMIYDCGLEDVERLGVNWNARFFGRATRADGSPADQIGLSSLTAMAPAMGAPNGALTLMTLGSNVEVNAVINALKTSSDSRLLADPNVVAANHESAKIEIVTEIPYQQLTEGLEGGSIGTTAFREAGVTLEVTPHIARDDTISMAINPRFSVLSGFTENDEQPIIDRREAKTTVRVQNGETFVLGGLRQRTRIQNRTGIPYLKDRKYIGKLFRFRQDTFRESELLVFITPQIIFPSSPPIPREEMAARYSDEELDCNRRAPDICWPCTDEDFLKSGGPRASGSVSGRSRPIATPYADTEVPPFMDDLEPTDKYSSVPYDADSEKRDSQRLPSAPRTADTAEQFHVAPAQPDRGTAVRTQPTVPGLPLTTRLKNAFRVHRQQTSGQQTGTPDPFGEGGSGAGTSSLDLNSLLDILPMSGRGKESSPQPDADQNPIRLLRFTESSHTSVGTNAANPRTSRSSTSITPDFQSENPPARNQPSAMYESRTDQEMRIQQYRMTEVPDFDDDPLPSNRD